MRTVATFVLRVLAESADPDALRGVARAVATGEERSFADGEELLAVLRALAGDEGSPDETGERDGGVGTLA